MDDAESYLCPGNFGYYRHHNPRNRRAGEGGTVCDGGVEGDVEMTVWTIKKNAVWGIYADGKYVATANNEEEAKLRLKSINTVENSRER